MCTDMRIGMCIDMFIDMYMDMCIEMIEDIGLCHLRADTSTRRL